MTHQFMIERPSSELPAGAIRMHSPTFIFGQTTKTLHSYVRSPAGVLHRMKTLGICWLLIFAKINSMFLRTLRLEFSRPRTPLLTYLPMSGGCRGSAGPNGGTPVRCELEFRKPLRSWPLDPQIEL